MPKQSRYDIPHYASNFQLAFYEAQSFLTAAGIIAKKARPTKFIEEEMDRNIGLIYAQYINHSYAFELLLKCIMIIENGYYFEGHNLFSLFKKLNPLTQGKIIERFNEYNFKRRNLIYLGLFEDVDILMVLEEAGEAFTDFRYLFEDGKKNVPHYDLQIATECLEYYIHLLKPELKKYDF